MAPEDATVALFQLRSHPSHDILLDGRWRRSEPTPRGGLHFVDLRDGPVAHLRNPVDTLMFHLPRAVLDELADDAGAPRINTLTAPDPWRTQDPVVDRLHPLILEGLTSATTAGNLLQEHVMLGLAVHFATLYGGLKPGALRLHGRLAPWQERRAMELLASSLAKELSLGSIAQECDLSLAYFGRAFKVSVGMSPHAWRQSRRVEQAKELLRSSAMPLTEIAADCGFADQSHFSRVFARHTNATPGAWRRMRHGARGH